MRSIETVLDEKSLSPQTLVVEEGDRILILIVLRYAYVIRSRYRQLIYFNILAKYLIQGGGLSIYSSIKSIIIRSIIYSKSYKSFIYIKLGKGVVEYISKIITSIGAYNIQEGQYCLILALSIVNLIVSNSKKGCS